MCVLDFHVSSRWPFHVDWFDEWKHFLELHKYWKEWKMQLWNFHTTIVDCSFPQVESYAMCFYFHCFFMWTWTWTRFWDFKTHSISLKLDTCWKDGTGSQRWLSGVKKVYKKENKCLSVTVMIFQFQVNSIDVDKKWFNFQGKWKSLLVCEWMELDHKLEILWFDGKNVNF